MALSADKRAAAAVISADFPGGISVKPLLGPDEVDVDGAGGGAPTDALSFADAEAEGEGEGEDDEDPGTTAAAVGGGAADEDVGEVEAVSNGLTSLVPALLPLSLSVDVVSDMLIEEKLY